MKKLHILAAAGHNGPFETVGVNSGKPLVTESEVGKVEVLTYICDFDGCKQHADNSMHNAGDSQFLGGAKADVGAKRGGNLAIDLYFTPSSDVAGDALLFGNDCTTPVKDYVPALLLNTGLKFFSWWINPTVKGDVYADKPYLYGLALNSFSVIGRDGEEENLASEELEVPSDSAHRIKFFSKKDQCEKFVFEKGHTYLLRFETNFISLKDSKYNIAIPTYGSLTFDIDVGHYANEHLDNANFVLKVGGIEGVDAGHDALVLKFAVVDE